MKRALILFLFLIFNQMSFAQNQPELIQDFSTTSLCYFGTIDNGISKIVNSYPTYIDLYNLDFALYKTIDLPEEVVNSPGFYIYYITRSMFDCDTTQLEYLVNMQIGETTAVKVYREDGSTFFDLPGYRHGSSGFAIHDVTVPLEVSDSTGTYLIFGIPFGTSKKLYRFCGQVPKCQTIEQSQEVLGAESNAEKKGFNLFPNPAEDQLRIQYDLQGHRQATMQIFDVSGNMVKQMKVGQGFKEILVDTSSLASGTYIVRLVTGDGVQLSEKFIKL